MYQAEVQAFSKIERDFARKEERRADMTKRREDNAKRQLQRRADAIF